MTDAWTLVVLPDTQYYALRHPHLLEAQTAWIREQRDTRNVRYVVHVGDVTHRNTRLEWRRARQALRRLDGVVPYAIALGNHDYGPAGSATTRRTGLHDVYPRRLDNAYHLFEAGGHAWVLVVLEWAPRDRTLAWAHRVLEAHDDRRAIVVTHAFLYHDGSRYDHARHGLGQEWTPHAFPTPGGKNDGEEIWQKLVQHHDVALVISGHVLGPGTAYRRDVTATGALCHQMCVNFQTRPMGGEGYLRLVEIDPEGTLRVADYSPVLDHWLDGPAHRFAVPLGLPARRVRVRSR